MLNYVPGTIKQGEGAMRDLREGKVGMVARRGSRGVGVLAIAMLVLAACAPPPGGGDPPPPAMTVISPASGPAGTWISVSPPNGECTERGYASLQATITMYSLGYVVTTGYSWTGGSFSENASSDPMVRLRMPPFAAAARYFVYLSCYGYNGSYQYAPAVFTVTAS